MHRDGRLRASGLIGAGAAVITVGLLLGCQTPAPTVMLTPAERLELESRALNLLLRAAESDLDDVSCNAIEALVRVAPRDGLPVFRKALRANSPLVRYAGHVALGELRDREALPWIAAGIRDSHPHVRLAAAFAACRCGRDGHVRLLMQTLKDAPDEGLRADAATLLGRLGEPRAVKWLRAALGHPGNKRSTRVTLALYGALATLGEHDAVDQLVFYSQGATEARADALLLLADLANPQVRDALRHRLLGVSEEYEEARLIAARGLGRLGYRDGFDLALQKLGFKDANANPNPDNPSRTYPIRSMAIHALAEIGDLRAIPPLRQIAADGSDARLQVAASYALLKLVRR